MKFFCPDCGVHFPEEFVNTLKCNFWKYRGLENIATKRKRQVWKYLTSFDFDKFAIQTGYSLNVDWNGAEFKQNDFEATYPPYKTMDDKEKKEFQREWFLFLNKAGDIQVNALMQYFLQVVWKGKK